VGSTGRCNTVGFRCCPDRRCRRGKVGPPGGLFEARKKELWEKWKAGDSISDIAQALQKQHAQRAEVRGLAQEPRRGEQRLLTCGDARGMIYAARALSLPPNGFRDAHEWSSIGAWMAKHTAKPPRTLPVRFAMKPLDLAGPRRNKRRKYSACLAVQFRVMFTEGCLKLRSRDRA
jgi:hypothetical protein